jgi:hypothetical protein
VFAQLRAEQPDNVEYKVMHLGDGVSFVHASSGDVPDGSNPCLSWRRSRNSAGTQPAGPPPPGTGSR